MTCAVFQFSGLDDEKLYFVMWRVLLARSPPQGKRENEKSRDKREEICPKDLTASNI